MYSDFWIVVNFCVGSRRNPYCDENYNRLMFILGNVTALEHSEFINEKITCHYDDSVPTSNVTFTPHIGWGCTMLVPFVLNYLICWYVWGTTDKRKTVTWLAALFCFYPQYVACKIIYQI